MSLTKIFLIAVALSAALPSSAQLLPRDLDGDGVADAYFNPALNVTWLKDTNLAGSNSFGVNGEPFGNGGMSHTTAIDWVAAANTNRFMGYIDWRLPITNPVNSIAFDFACTYDGSTDCGENISAPGSKYPGAKGSELAFMYYIVLQNISIVDIYGNIVYFRIGNSGPFIHGGSIEFWSESIYSPDTSKSWLLSFDYGEQIPVDNTFHARAWLVRTGDSGVFVSDVPELPQNYLLLLGLAILASTTGFKRLGFMNTACR